MWLVARVGVLSAFGVAAMCIFRVPGFDGRVYFHLGETVILTSALLLGGRGGAFVGGISSALADVILGAPVWAPFSFVIHGAEGFIAGRFSSGKGGKRDMLAMAAGCAVMVVGYACAVAMLYGKEVVPLEIFGDTMQALLGIASSYPLSRFLVRRFPQMTGRS
ncbi:hypothetical protein FACS1894216_08970 [Synergistales bacterium]|nr:hypothetical protein FACS1894216_08970 [Synergistales bacterium]